MRFWLCRQGKKALRAIPHLRAAARARAARPPIHALFPRSRLAGPRLPGARVCVMQSRVWRGCGLEQLQAIAGAVGRGLQRGHLVLLRGPIGAGKSEFARAMVRAAVGQEELAVPSPTFLLAQDYASKRAATTAPSAAERILHADLHRLYASTPDTSVPMPVWKHGPLAEPPSTGAEAAAVPVIAEADLEAMGFSAALLAGAVLCEWPEGLSKSAVWGGTGAGGPIMVSVQLSTAPATNPAAEPALTGLAAAARAAAEAAKVQVAGRDVELSWWVGDGIDSMHWSGINWPR
mgnify:CR=1 FL=1